jgi:hypothetical protein
MPTNSSPCSPKRSPACHERFLVSRFSFPDRSRPRPSFSSSRAGIHDQVGWPLACPRIYVDQQRRIGRQDHDVRVALHAGQKRRVTESGIQIRSRAALDGCVLTDKNLGTGSVVRILSGRIPLKGPRRLVVMLVDHVRHTAGNKRNRFARERLGVRPAAPLSILRCDGPATHSHD